MRIGHAGLALLSKRVRRTIPLVLLVAAAYGPDIVELVLRVAGFQDRALSHSLVSVGIVATVMAVTYGIWRRDAFGGLVVWLTYVSHWPADFITGFKPTWPGGPVVGLDFYDHPVLEGLMELAVLGVCWMIYRGGRLSPRAAPE